MRSKPINEPIETEEFGQVPTHWWIVGGAICAEKERNPFHRIDNSCAGFFLRQYQAGLVAMECQFGELV
jgi:hypothetical protein